jgi:hypothetical protein
MRSALTDTALQDLYTPTPDDLTFMEHATTSPVAAFGGLVLKTFQRSGSLLSFAEVPPRLLRHLATATGVLLPHDCLQADTPQRLDGSWVPVRWGQAVTNRHRRAMPVGTVDRTYLELCVLSGVVMERKSGDLCIEGSAPFSDYRAQWVSWAAYVQDAPRSCAQGGIASAPAQCVQPLHTWLAATIRTTDAMFSTHTARSITGGAPVLRRLATQPAPEGFAVIDQLLRERMPEYTIVAPLGRGRALPPGASRLAPATCPPPSAMAALSGRAKPHGRFPGPTDIR